jgi:hypothetical protein
MRIVASGGHASDKTGRDAVAEKAKEERLEAQRRAARAASLGEEDEEEEEEEEEEDEEEEDEEEDEAAASEGVHYPMFSTTDEFICKLEDAIKWEKDAAQVSGWGVYSYDFLVLPSTS